MCYSRYASFGVANFDPIDAVIIVCEKIIDGPGRAASYNIGKLINTQPFPLFRNDEWCFFRNLRGLFDLRFMIELRNQFSFEGPLEKLLAHHIEVHASSLRIASNASFTMRMRSSMAFNN